MSELCDNRTDCGLGSFLEVQKKSLARVASERNEEGRLAHPRQNAQGVAQQALLVVTSVHMKEKFISILHLNDGMTKCMMGF